MPITRGGTPTLIFSDIDIDLRDAVVAYITIYQNGVTVLEKTIEDITITEDTISTTLTQKESLKVKEGPAVIQIRTRMPDGSCPISEPIYTEGSVLLKNGVI